MIKHLVCICAICFANVASGQDTRIDQPRENFEKLWEITRDRYCNFDLLDIDLQERYLHYKPQVTDSTTNEALFSLCGSLLKELDDRHVWITRKGEYEPTSIESGSRSKFESEFPTNPAAFKFLRVNDSLLAARGFSEFTIVNANEGQIGVIEYCFSDALVYLRINSMAGIKKSEVKKAMSEIVDSAASRNGLLLDIRINGGGYDNTGYLFAQYLTSGDQLAIYKRTRKPKTEDYTALKKRVIKANSRLNYTGPIVLMTSDYSVSAADVFAVALSKFPHVTIVGDRTAGFFSDVSHHKLPNGWTFTLSTQKYYSQDMVNYERIGVQPNHTVLNTREACEKGEDPVLAKSIELLVGNNK